MRYDKGKDFGLERFRERVLAFSRMSSPTSRRHSRATSAVLAGCLLAASFLDASALPEVLSASGPPSSVTARYGRARPLSLPPGTPLFAIPTESGIEIRDAATAAEAPVGTFRTPGPVRSVAIDGNTAYLFAASRGIVAVDLSNPAAPQAIGSHGDLGEVSIGAASPNGYGLVAASDNGRALHFLGRSAPGAMSFLTTVTFPDDRDVRGISARADSFLVASVRQTPFPRLFLTVYRLPMGAAAPVVSQEIGISFEDAFDLAWVGDVAFVADGIRGVLVVNLSTGARRNFPVVSLRSVGAVDADDQWVMAAASAATLVRFQRVGAALDSLANPVNDNTALEPTHVGILGTRVLVSTVDQIGVVEPDESARSLIEFRNLDLTPFPPPVGGTGRVRRVAWSAGYAYVADYTGGLRVYRAEGPDTSLVGVLPAGGSARVVDLAIDPVRNLVYLAAGSAGLQVVDIADPSSPSMLGSLPLPGLTSAVAVAAGNLVVVGRRGSPSGVTVVDATLPGSPAARGQVPGPSVQDPRSIAIQGTMAFVADEILGLMSIDFTNPDSPALVGTPSGFASRDLELAGNILLVATRSGGLQVVDVVDPMNPSLAATLETPPILGVGRSGNSAVLAMGNAGLLVVDIGNPASPVLRGPISVPGFAEDAAWAGDTLLVAASLALERMHVNSSGGSPGSLTIEVDGASALPRVRVRWAPVALAGAVGLNLYRDLLPAHGGTDTPAGKQVNGTLLPTSATEAFDDSLAAGSGYRYRLEAFLANGTSQELAEGTTYISSNQSLGRPFPNPFRPGSGGVASLPYRLISGTAGLELIVHDVAGRLIRRIPLPSGGGGFGQATWDGRDFRGRVVPDGVYFMSLAGSGIDEGRSLVVLH